MANAKSASDIMQYYYGEHYVTDSTGEEYFRFSPNMDSQYWKPLKVNENEYQIIDPEEAQLEIEIEKIDWSQSILWYSISNMGDSDHTFWGGDIHLQQCIDGVWYHVMNGYASTLTPDMVVEPKETANDLIVHLDIIWDDTTNVAVTEGIYRILYEYFPGKYISEEFRFVWPE